MNDKERGDRETSPENMGMRRENQGIPFMQQDQSREIRKGHKWNCLIGLACTIRHPDGEN